MTSTQNSQVHVLYTCKDDLWNFGLVLYLGPMRTVRRRISWWVMYCTHVKTIFETLGWSYTWDRWEQLGGGSADESCTCKDDIWNFGLVLYLGQMRTVRRRISWWVMAHHNYDFFIRGFNSDSLDSSPKWGLLSCTEVTWWLCAGSEGWIVTHRFTLAAQPKFRLLSF